MGTRLMGLMVEAVHRWEQTDLLGLCAPPAGPARDAAAAGGSGAVVAGGSDAVAAGVNGAVGASGSDLPPAKAMPGRSHAAVASGGAAVAAGVSDVPPAKGMAGGGAAQAAMAAAATAISVPVAARVAAPQLEAPPGRPPTQDEDAASPAEPPPAQRRQTAPFETPPHSSSPQGTALREPPSPAAGTPPLQSPATSQERPPASARPAPSVSLPGFSKTAARGTPRVFERLLILDTETTALHPDDGECIEVGAVLFHVPTRAVLTQVSFLLPCRVNGAEAINGIPAAVSQLEQPWREALRCFEAMVAAADGILAHNAAFDRQWFGRGPLPALDKPWICSMDDIYWPAELHLRAAPSVRDLDIAHGVPVWAAHRALTDCIYLVQVLERCGDLEGLLRAASEPRQLYRAQLSYSERHQAKEAGFRWNEPVRGAWTKRLSEREASALPFPVNPVLSA